MGWRTEICGVLPADGRRPARGSSTKDCNYAEDLGMGEENSRTRLLQLHCISSHFPSSDVVLGVLVFWGVFFLKSFVFQNEALVAKEKH